MRATLSRRTVMAGTLGNVCGSWIAWGVGAKGGRPFIERYGRYVHITPKRMAMADRWFDRYGNKMQFSGVNWLLQGLFLNLSGVNWLEAKFRPKISAFKTKKSAVAWAMKSSAGCGFPFREVKPHTSWPRSSSMAKPLQSSAMVMLLNCGASILVSAVVPTRS